MEIEIKEKLHQLIDNIENNDLLSFYYHVILNTQNNKSNISSLTLIEIDELFISFNESFETENLLNNDDVKSKYKEWL